MREFELIFQLLTLRDKWLENTSHSGRPLNQTSKNIEKVITKVRTNRYSHEKIAADLAGELSFEGIEISAITVRKKGVPAGGELSRAEKSSGELN